ncbi:hypothetical protein BGZ65_009162, partial [Modicella reniformis]
MHTAHTHTRSNSQLIPFSQEQQYHHQLLDSEDDFPASPGDLQNQLQQRPPPQQQQQQQQQQPPPPPPPQQLQHYPHNFEMLNFLTFAVQAACLVEKLHQNGVIHGQLSPTSFRWEESSSLNTPDNNNSNTNGNVTGISNISIGRNYIFNTSFNYLSLFPSSSVSTLAFKSDPDLTSNNNNNNNNSSSSNNLAVFPSTTTSPRQSFQHPSRKENQSSPSQLSLDKSGSIAKTSTAVSNGSVSVCVSINSYSISNSTSNNNSSTNLSSANLSSANLSSNGGSKAAPPKQRRFSLVLDCTHLSLGERTVEPVDSPARRGLREHTPSSSCLSHGSPSSCTLSTDLSGTAPAPPPPPEANVCSSNSIGSLLDPTLFSLSNPNLQPYNTHSATVIPDAITSRMARLKRTLLHSSTPSAVTQSSQNPTASPSSSQALSTAGTSGSTQHLVVKQHFMLHVPQELHSPPGCVLPVQIDIYSL